MSNPKCLWILIGCLMSSGCAHWAATPEASIRRMEATHLRACLERHSCSDQQACIDESKARCKAQKTRYYSKGMELTCGMSQLWTEEPYHCNN
jgi:hypothetical protein